MTTRGTQAQVNICMLSLMSPRSAPFMDWSHTPSLVQVNDITVNDAIPAKCGMHVRNNAANTNKYITSERTPDSKWH